MKTEIVYEDNDLIVAYKPAGLAVQTAGIGRPDMVSELKNYLQKADCGQGKRPGEAACGRSGPYLGVIHRLDQPVEGLLVFAKNPGSAAALTKQLRRQEEPGMLHKNYRAVIWGNPAAESGELVDYLYKNKDNKAVVAEVPESDDKCPRERRMKSPEESVQVEDAKKAVLLYRCLRHKELGALSGTEEKTGEVTLADIRIRTGRFHQIRAQMAHAGTPLLGDQKYGSGESMEASRLLGVRNVALCAWGLEFAHPVTGKQMHFETEPRGKIFAVFYQ